MKPFLFAVVILLSLLYWTLSCESSNRERGSLGTTKEEIQLRLDGKLRQGATPTEVLTVLDQLKVEHSDYLKEVRAIQAIVRDVKGNFPVSESIQILFYFNEKDTLSNYELKSVFTGP